MQSHGIREAAGLARRGLGMVEQRLKLQVWAVDREGEGMGVKNWRAGTEQHTGGW